MAIIWPATIPDDILADSYFESPPDNLIRQDMGAGPPKVRPRSTSATRPFGGKIKMTQTQIGYLDTFFVTTTAYGSLSFEFVHPRTGSTVDCMFAEPPKYSSAGGIYWWATISMVVIP